MRLVRRWRDRPRLRWEKRAWLGFWIVVAVGLLALNGLNLALMMSATPFEGSYLLGVDEVDETHELRWFGGWEYMVSVEFDPPYGTGPIEGKESVRDVVGGDIAVQLTNESGEEVIRRRFLFAEAPGTGDLTDFDMWTYQHLFAYAPKFTDRHVLRVTTIKTSEAPRPRRVRLNFLARGLEYFVIVVLVDNAIAIGVSGLLALVYRFVLHIIRQVFGTDRPSPIPGSGRSQT